MDNYRIDDMSPQGYVGVRANEERVPCPAGFVVTWPQCHDLHMNTACYRRKEHPCWNCIVGGERRHALAKDITGNKYHHELPLVPELPKRQSMVRGKRP